MRALPVAALFLVTASAAAAPDDAPCVDAPAAFRRAIAQARARTGPRDFATLTPASELTGVLGALEILVREKRALDEVIALRERLVARLAPVRAAMEPSSDGAQMVDDTRAEAAAQLRPLRLIRDAISPALVHRIAKLGALDRAFTPATWDTYSAFDALFFREESAEAFAPFGARLTWFGTAADDRCGRRGAAVDYLVRGTRHNGWSPLYDGLSLDELVRLTHRVLRVRSAARRVSCLDGFAKPTLRYDAATREVIEQAIEQPRCLTFSFLRFNMPDAGFHRPDSVTHHVPDDEWVRLRDRLLRASP